jgi:hypothetical protein
MVKKWAGLPNSATNAVIHLPSGLDIKSISQLYTETHVLSHIRTRLQGDAIVNHMLDCQVERESEYVRKKCISVTAEKEYTRTVGSNTAQQEIPNFDYEGGDRDKMKFINEVREDAKLSLNCHNKEKWTSHVNTLVQQGQFLELATAQHEDVIWKSYMFDLKKGTLKFILNASLDTLPTAANLVKWNKKTSDKCKCRESTLHILNACKVSLDNGKYLWRHNNIINYIVQSVDTEKFTVYADLPRHTAAGGSTIPVNICITPQKPDIVISERKSNSIYICELTLPFE